MSVRPFALLVLLLTVLAGCATPVPPPAATGPSPAPQAVPAQPETGPEPRQDKLKHLAGRSLKPIPTRPLNAKANCSFRDETGYRAQLELDVKGAKVEKLNARVDVPRQGSCNFRLADFQQTDSLPNVVLAAKRSDCKVSLWEQGEQVTVAFRGCRSECSGGSADYLWPILVDNRKGSCS
jgi:hypothetical protein